MMKRGLKLPILVHTDKTNRLAETNLPYKLSNCIKSNVVIYGDIEALTEYTEDGHDYTLLTTSIDDYIIPKNITDTQEIIDSSLNTFLTYNNLN